MTYLPAAMFPSRGAPTTSFEAYKLAPGEPVQHAHALPATAATHTAAATTLGFRELKARTALRTLVPARTAGRACAGYVAADGQVVLIEMDGAAPRFHAVARVAGASDGAEHLPTLCSVDAATWVVGCAQLVLVHLDGVVPVCTVHIDFPDVPSSGTHSLPWHVVDACWDGADTLLLLERACRGPSGPRAAPGRGADAHEALHRRTTTMFDVALVRVARARDWAGAAASLVWHVSGPEPLSYSALSSMCVLGAEAHFGRPLAAPAAAAEPTPPPPFGEAPHAAPYSWAQTDDTVTLAFSLPSTTDKRDIRAHFSHKGMSLSLALPEARVSEDLDVHPTEAAIRSGRYQSRTLWGEIDASASVWTWEHVDGRQGRTGLLTLHLAKAHEGTRWPSVFGDDDAVAETLDPSELLTMLEGLDKYTQQGGALLHDGLEEEDASAGTPLELTCVLPDGTVNHAPDRTTLLARSALGHDLLVKHDVDGEVYAPPSPLAWAPWTHVETIPAISYVLASKRDAHPVYVYRAPHATSVLAVEPKHASSYGGTLYVYSVPEARHDAKRAKVSYGQSRVLRVGPADAGPVLGAAVVPRDEPLVLCLCPTSLVVVEGGLFT